MSFHLRDAEPRDGSDLTILADAATRRLVSWVWGMAAEDGQSGFEVGRQRILSSEEDPAHRSRWRVAEADDRVVGGLNSYRLLPQHGTSTGDNALSPLAELKTIAVDTWYVSVASVFPEARGQGIGRALLAEADRLATIDGTEQVTLIVASFNPRARNLYEQVGFRETARRPFRPFTGTSEQGDWVLMARDVSSAP